MPPRAAKQPAKKPTLTPKEKLIKQIIAVQRDLAKKYGTTIVPVEPKEQKLDAMTTKLVDFLSTRPFGCNTEKAIEFAEILTGKEIKKHIRVNADSDDITKDSPIYKLIAAGGMVFIDENNRLAVCIKEDTDEDTKTIRINYDGDTDVDFTAIDNIATDSEYFRIIQMTDAESVAKLDGLFTESVLGIAMSYINLALKEGK